jgi:hypothetical protein
MKPSDKHPKIEDFLEQNFGRSSAITEAMCLRPPIGCGKALEQTDFALQNEGQTFRDPLSIKEYRISGLCQDCQDLVFGSMEE